jgi:hypothetical protein
MTGRRDSRACSATLASGAAILALIASWAAPADQSARKASAHLETVVVTAKRWYSPEEDAEIAFRLQKALHDDPYILDTHVTVETRNGIIYLEGFVLDDWDLDKVLRKAWKLYGYRRVINDLELHDIGAD